jgi:hypothetical protein
VSKNRQKLEVGYMEYMEDVVKIWSQTGAGKLSKFGEKDWSKLDRFLLGGSTARRTGRGTG